LKKRCTPAEFVRLARAREADGGLSLVRQLLELTVLLPVYGVGPGFYQMAGFWRKEISWSDKRGHLNSNAYRKMLEQLNPYNYRKLSENKLAETALFRLFDIPAPEFLGYFNPASGRDVTGTPLRSLDDLRRFFGSQADGRKICFKPLEGWAGQGFEIVTIKRQDAAPSIYRVATGAHVDPSEFKEAVIDRRHGGSSIIQAYLNQHRVLSSFNPSSVNTVRLWVARGDDGVASALLAYQRIGREGSLVDNQSSGGIVAPIDLDTGRLRPAIDGTCRHEVYSRHPDHGAAIEGETLPFFNESVELGKRVLCSFPEMRFAGIDIAISPEGPQIIELNASPDREGAAFVGVPSAELLGQVSLG
jgi:hypothetical protein